MDWLRAAPYMEPFVSCLAANRVLHYAHPSLAQQVSFPPLLSTSLDPHTQAVSRCGQLPIAPPYIA